MLLSLNWLREFVPYEGSAEELGAKLTMLGLELENIYNPYQNISNIVIGRVTTCEKHPEADKLSICTVDVGTELLSIVCGAPNVAANQLVPVATVGTIMPNGMEIKKAKLRNAPSFGMICSERELGLSDEHNGIMVLPEEFKVGTKLVDAFELDTEILEIGITPNRADALSVLGLAREAALAFNLPLTLPKFNLEEFGADSSNDVQIVIANPDLCPLYQARIIEGVNIKNSPSKIRYRLNAIGVRPISNIVDVTNYILMELGQPLHAFDLDKLQANKIVISPANNGEKIITLDGQERELIESDLLIRDGEKPVALAGVMGGLETEISDASTNVFLESAIFRPGTIRKTSRRLALSSESSYRYERGVDQVNNTYAMNRAAYLMAELSGGKVRTGTCKNEAKIWQSPSISFKREKAINLLGIDVAEEFCENTLVKLGCEVTKESSDWKVTCPSHRQDLSREVDLIEEIARVYGVDRIPELLPAIARPLDNFGTSESKFDFVNRIKNMIKGMGLNEAINYSFVGHKDLDLLSLDEAERIYLLNPMSEEQNVLRTRLAPALLQNIKQNIAHSNSSIRLFEVAKTFYKDESSDTGAKEIYKLAFALYGSNYEKNWGRNEEDLNYLDLRALIENVFTLLHLPSAEFKASNEHSYFAPSGEIFINNKVIGEFGKVKTTIADNYHARKEIWLAELDLDAIYGLYINYLINKPLQFKALAVYPPIRRDITVICNENMLSSQIIEEVEKLKIKLLEDINLIDIYEPKDSSDKNLSFRLSFRHKERTLQDAEVDKERDKIANSLIKNLGVKI